MHQTCLSWLSARISFFLTTFFLPDPPLPGGPLEDQVTQLSEFWLAATKPVGSPEIVPPVEPPSSWSRKRRLQVCHVQRIAVEAHVPRTGGLLWHRASSWLLLCPLNNIPWEGTSWGYSLKKSYDRFFVHELSSLIYLNGSIEFHRLFLYEMYFIYVFVHV